MLRPHYPRTQCAILLAALLLEDCNATAAPFGNLAEHSNISQWR
jgi:hypothetical protein